MKKYLEPAVKAVNLETLSVIATSIPLGPGTETSEEEGGFTRDQQWNSSDWSEESEEF